VDNTLLVGFGFLLAIFTLHVLHLRNTHVNVLQALLILCCTIWIGHAIGFTGGMLDRYPHLNKVYLPFLTATGPLWFLYVRGLITGGNKYTSANIKHFSPVFLSTVLALPFFFQTAEFKNQYIEVNVTSFVLLTIYLSTRIAELTCIIYILFTFPLVRKSSKDTNTANHILLLCMSTIALVAVLLRFLGSVTGNQYMSVYLPVLAMFLAIAIYFYLTQGNLTLPDERRSNRSVAIKTEEGFQQLEEYRKLIRENGWHLNPNFKIQELSRRVGMPKKQLSALINRESGDNFKRFVNDMRIEHAKELLLKTELNISEVAFKSGFNSQSVFYEQFKINTKTAPGNYRKSISDKPKPKIYSEEKVSSLVDH